MANHTSSKITKRFEIRNQNGKDLVIGQGGMGTVYHGVDVLTNEPVAIKLLRGDMTMRDPDMIQRFIREGEALRQLNHPNIVKMLDAVQVEGEHYLVMEYVTGGSLRDVLDKTPRLSVPRALYISLDLADALTRAHRLNILHRDIKPDNVLIAEDGTPRLTDFGMARMGDTPHITQDGAIVGTLAYMAPEVFSGSTADEKTDIWSFGVMLYEMLAGRRPFEQEQPGALINAIMTQHITDLETHRPDMPIALVDLIYRMLAKDPLARISSIRLVGAELDAILRGDGKTILPASVALEDDRFDTETPAPAPLARTSQRLAPNNLPSQPTAFIGRQRELADLQKLLAEPSNRLVTLLGTGGIGKTRLSLELATTQLNHFKDGVYFVSLAALDDVAFIAREIADATHYSGDRENMAGLMDYFRDKHILLIMDNFEHLTAGANLLSDILQVSPHAKIVVTSRERLRLKGETVYEVDNLPVPKKNENTPEALKKYAAADLFIQSARRVMPTFDIDAQNASDVAHILRLVQGLPLGIELAAAWLEMLPLDEIAREIEKSLDFLETDLRDVPERHRSLRAVFNYSWNLMTPAEQEVFVKLSIFRGGFERDAAEKVAGASLKLLTTLANKSLIQRDTNGRYYVHKILRQYAEDGADEATKLDAHMHHGMYYGHYIGQLTSALNSPKEGAALMDAIEMELENLRVAWHSAISSNHYDMLDQALDTLVTFYIGRSLIREGIEMFTILTDQLLKDRKQNTDLYWMTVSRRCWLASRIGNYDSSLREATQAYEYFKAKNNALEMAVALNQMSYANMMKGDYPRSIQFAGDAIEIMEDMKDSATWYMSMANYGYAQFLAGNLQDARSIYESILHTLDIFPTSPSSTGYYKNNLGEILRNMGEGHEAARLFQEAYDIFKDEKNLRGLAFTTNNLAGTVFSQGNYKASIDMYEEAYRIYKEIGDRQGIGHSLSALGNIEQGQGHYKEAHEYYFKSLTIRREIQDKRGIASSLMDLALTELNMEDYEKALICADEAIAIRREIQDVQGLSESLAQKALGLVRMNHLDEAETLTLEALAIGERIQYNFVIVQSKLVLGNIAQARGQDDEAIRLFKESISNSQSDSFLGMALVSMIGIAEIREKHGDFEGALRIVAVIDRFPHGFIASIDQRINALVARLKDKFPHDAITSTVSMMNKVDVQKFIQDVLRDRA